MENSISYSRLMNMPVLWIMNPKSFIRTVFISFIFQISVKIKNILLKIKFEFRNIQFITLIRFKYFPSSKEICWRNYRPI